MSDPLTLHRVTRHPEGGWRVEEHEARLEPEGWMKPGGEWVPVYVIPGVDGLGCLWVPVETAAEHGYHLSRRPPLPPSASSRRSGRRRPWQSWRRRGGRWGG